MGRKSSSDPSVEREKENEEQLLRGRKKIENNNFCPKLCSSRLQHLMVLLVGHSAQQERLPRKEFSLELNKNRLGNSTRPGTAPIKQIRYK